MIYRNKKKTPKDNVINKVVFKLIIAIKNHITPIGPNRDFNNIPKHPIDLPNTLLPVFIDDLLKPEPFCGSPRLLRPLYPIVIFSTKIAYNPYFYTLSAMRTGQLSSIVLWLLKEFGYWNIESRSNLL